MLFEPPQRLGIAVAALFVETAGVYWHLPDVDPWDEQRDARKYRGPYPVVAHPPCGPWSQLAHINQKRYGHKVGDDGNCFFLALISVGAFGGVLEHPANSYAWAHFGLATPQRGCWQMRKEPSGSTAWVTEVSQIAYGHVARKRTWLYAVSRTQPPALDWSEDRQPQAQVGWCDNHGSSPLPRISKHTAARTPLAFRDALLDIARATRGQT